jgi:hypothetical protein
MSQPTKRMLEFLDWARRQEPFTSWPIGLSIMQQKARKAGYIERLGNDGHPGLPLVTWKL